MIRVLAILLITGTAAIANMDMPKGLMLNLDFEEAKNGLIPSKSLFPLYTPLGDFQIERHNYRNMLIVEYGQGVNIAHSSLLDPNGDEWVISLRVYPLTDGIIVSQCNDEHGYVIYVEDGHIAASVRSGHFTFKLQEPEKTGREKFLRRWVTIELRINKSMALLNLNRKRVSMVRQQPPLDGENLRIRLGNHNAIPAPFKNTDVIPTGFTGAINSLKILRQ